jgi:DNA-binding MarR family transcriptional regulator
MSTNQIVLTTNEFNLMEACLNHPDRVAQLSDNSSNGDLDMATLSVELEMSKQQIAGIVSSLTQKGLVFRDKDVDHGNDIIWLTEDGVRATFDVIDGISHVVLSREAKGTSLPKPTPKKEGDVAAPAKANNKVSKKEIATSVYKEMVEAGSSRKEIIETFMTREDLLMSKPGASTYYQNIKKATK